MSDNNESQPTSTDQKFNPNYENQIILQPIASQGLSMNVNTQAHLRNDEQQKSLEQEKVKSTGFSTIKIDENENELEASKSMNKSDFDQ